MIPKRATRGYLLVMLLCGGWLSCQPAASGATTGGSSGVLTLNRLSGVFTVTDFQVVNGVSEAVGWLTAEATDTAGVSADVITNVPIRVPVTLSGALAGKASLLAEGGSEPIPPPTLGTNLCTILAISIEFVDVTIPGLGLNVHVNQLLIGVRADRDTRLGDVLCTLLGDDFGNSTNGAISLTPSLNVRLEGTRVMLDARGPATLQSTTSLTEPISWTNVLALSSTLQTLSPTAPLQFFRLALSGAESAQVSRGGFSLGSVTGVFTVSDFRKLSGTSMAAGWLSANVTDTSGATEVGMFTNFPVRVPVSGVLAGNPIDVEDVDDPVILPQLSTNTCSLLGIVVGAIDVTIPGLGLNLHVNQISIIVRADRETTVGDLLCTLLGDDLLGSPAGSTESSKTLAQATSTSNSLTVQQLQGLAGIVLGYGVLAPTTGDNPELTSKTKGSAKKQGDTTLLQSLLQQAVATVLPSTSLPKIKGKKPAKSAAR